jgi:hypothetical protein
LNFFLAIHRSIFDLQFYKDARIFKKRYIFAFFIQQAFFTAFIAAAAQVYYLTDPQRGIVDNVVKVFNGMEIRKGILYPGRDVPYVLPSQNAIPLLERFAGFPLLLDRSEDSLFIIDTNSQLNYSIKLPVFMLRADRMEIIVRSDFKKDVPYSKLLPNPDQIFFTKPFITEYIHRYSLMFFIQLFMTNLFISGLLLSFSIIFLSMAAYFFRVDRSRAFKQHLKVAFFAVTPITVGSVLTAISGVTLSWTWHVLVFLSTIVMFRAMLATGTVTSRNSGEDE